MATKDPIQLSSLQERRLWMKTNHYESKTPHIVFLLLRTTDKWLHQPTSIVLQAAFGAWKTPVLLFCLLRRSSLVLRLFLIQTILWLQLRKYSGLAKISNACLLFSTAGWNWQSETLPMENIRTETEEEFRTFPSYILFHLSSVVSRCTCMRRVNMAVTLYNNCSLSIIM